MDNELPRTYISYLSMQIRLEQMAFSRPSFLLLPPMWMESDPALHPFSGAAKYRETFRVAEIAILADANASKGTDPDAII